LLNPKSGEKGNGGKDKQKRPTALDKYERTCNQASDLDNKEQPEATQAR
jgi:hypothetical protein